MKYYQSITLALCLATCVGIPSGALHAADKDVERLQTQVNQVSQELRDLQSSFRQQGADIAQKMSSVDQIRSEWSGFQGQLDAINQQQQLLLDQLRKFIDEFDGRLRAVEKRQHAEVAPSGNTTPLEVAAEATGNTLTLAERATQMSTDDIAQTPATTNAYQAGLAAVQHKDFPTATVKFREFLKTNATGAQAAQAQFWLGESLFAQKQWHSAVKEYQVMLDRFPKSGKQGTAMLKQAQAFTQLGMKTQARAAYQRIVSQWPSSREAKQATAALQNIQLQDANATRTK